MARGEETGNHPNRKVHAERFSTGTEVPPDFTSQGWPATPEEWATRGQPGSPVTAEHESLGEYKGWHYIKHLPSDRGPARLSTRHEKGYDAW